MKPNNHSFDPDAYTDLLMGLDAAIANAKVGGPMPSGMEGWTAEEVKEERDRIWEAVRHRSIEEVSEAIEHLNRKRHK